MNTKVFILIGMLVLHFNLSAQIGKPKITVLNVDSRGLALDPVQMGNLVRIELEKIGTFEVMDRYDVSYLIDKNKLDISNCYGKLCLVDIGTVIKSEKMFSGSVENYGDKIIITMRMIDVNSATVEKTQVGEYLNYPKELQRMISLTIRQMFNLENDQMLINQLTKPNQLEALPNNFQKRLRLDGPRMGVAYFSGKTAEYLQAPKKEGGFDVVPLFFQFGYQFEKQYLNEGNFQALFEFIPLVTGVDQGYFIPSFTILNGLRNNKNGWEFAFGPTLRFISQAEGYYVDGKWTRKTESTPAEQETELRLDSRGDLRLSTGFVIAFGKTFRSGRLNIPLNAYYIPHKEGGQVGISFGFNAKND